MVVLLGWVTFLAGGVYPWVWIPAALGTLVLAVHVSAAGQSDSRVGATDAMLVLTASLIALQLVPLPIGILQRFDPHAPGLRDALWLLPPQARQGVGVLPLSILPGDTMAALGIFATAGLLYWTCRQICQAGGTGHIVRSLAIMGIVGSVAAIVQRAENQELLYGFWRPLDAGARPYGPFVNRNHFATWAMMICPLIFGYLLARAPEPRHDQPIAVRMASAAKQIGSVRSWLICAVCLLTVAVLLSASRSGTIGLMCGFALTAILSRSRQTSHTRRWTVVQALLLAIAVLSFANFNSLMNRVETTLATSPQGRGRPAIWRDAARLAIDFRWTGTGTGTFAAAIIPYQTAEPGYAIGDAHNHYLQVAAEGGLMISVPAGLTVVTFLILFGRRLMEGDGSLYLIRVGAASGIAGALLQSFWETGLRMPANAMLLAVLAAIATQAVPPSSRGHRH